jgi:hypothetical protein
VLPVGTGLLADIAYQTMHVSSAPHIGRRDQPCDILKPVVAHGHARCCGHVYFEWPIAKRHSRYRLGGVLPDEWVFDIVAPPVW